MRSCFLSSFVKFRSAVSEEKSKMSQPIRGQGGHLVFFDRPEKTQTWWTTLRSCFLSSFVEFRSAVSEEKSKMSQPIKDQGGHFVFPIGPKSTNLVEDVEILLPVKSCWIPARRGGVEVAGWTVDRTIRVRFPAYPHRVWALWWQRGKRRLRASRCPCRGRLDTLKTPSCPWRWVPGSRSKMGTWTTVPSLYSWNIAECDVKPQPTNQHRWIPFSGLGGEVENVSANQRPGRTSLFFSIGPKKTQTWWTTLRSCFLSSFVEFRSAVSEEKSKMSQPIKDQGGHFVFPIGPKSTNLVEDVEILLPVKSCWIPARRGGVEVAGWTVDRTIRVRFPAYPHRVWALWWQRGKRRLRASRCPCRGRLDTLKTPSCPWRWVPGSRSKMGTWTTVPSLYSWNIAECDVKPQPTNQHRWIPFSGLGGEVENVSANQRPGQTSCFVDRPEKHKLGGRRWDLASCQVSLNSVQRFQRTTILFFFDRFEKHKLGRVSWDLDSCQVPLYSVQRFRGEVENVSANRRTGRPFCFSDRPEKHKLGRRRWDLASCQVSLNSVQRFQRRSLKCLSQSKTRAAILFFSDRPEKHKLGRERWNLASCQVLLNSSPPRWRRGSGLDCGSDDPGSIPGIPSPRVGPLMAKR